MSATYNLSTAACDYLKIIFNTRSPRQPQLMLRSLETNWEGTFCVSVLLEVKWK